MIAEAETEAFRAVVIEGSAEVAAVMTTGSRDVPPYVTKGEEEGVVLEEAASEEEVTAVVEKMLNQTGVGIRRQADLGETAVLEVVEAFLVLVADLQALA